MTSVRTIPSTSSDSPIVAASAPRGRSRARAAASRLSTISRWAETAASTPIGTLMNRIQRQPSASVRMPPSRTPAAPPAPPMAPQIPTARLRAGPSVKVVVRIESEAGAMTAPPSPWTARAAISTRLAVGEAAGQRGEREQEQARDEHPPAPEQVSRAAAEEQEAGEGDRIGVDDPLQVDLGEVEPRADRGQRDVDDRDVEDDHELRQAGQEEGRAQMRARGARDCVLPCGSSLRAHVTFLSEVEYDNHRTSPKFDERRTISGVER